MRYYSLNIVKFKFSELGILSRKTGKSKQSVDVITRRQAQADYIYLAKKEIVA